MPGPRTLALAVETVIANDVATAGAEVRALLLVVGGLVGVLAHEATHYAIVRIAGRDATLSLVELECRWVLPDDGPTWVDRLAARAPILVGCAVGVLVLVGDVIVPLAWATVPGWLTYTAGGVIGEAWGGASDRDLRVERVDGRGDDADERSDPATPIPETEDSP